MTPVLTCRPRQTSPWMQSHHQRAITASEWIQRLRLKANTALASIHYPCRKLKTTSGWMHLPHPEHRPRLKANSVSASTHYPYQSTPETRRQRKRRTLGWISLHKPRPMRQPTILRQHVVSLMFAGYNTHTTPQIQLGNGERVTHPPPTRRCRKVRQAQTWTHRHIKKEYEILPSWCVASPTCQYSKH